MDHERLLDNIAARYVLIKRQCPDLTPDELVSMIADQVGPDAELSLATVEHAAGTSPSWTTIQRFVYALERCHRGSDDATPT